MEKITFKYHQSIFMWGALVVLLGLISGAEGLVAGVMIGFWLFVFAGIARWMSFVTLDEHELTIKKMSGSVSIPLSQISAIEHQKSIFGSYGIVRITISAGKAIKIKRVPNVELFVREIKVRMKK